MLVLVLQPELHLYELVRVYTTVLWYSLYAVLSSHVTALYILLSCWLEHLSECAS
jgi:hypothetical protein